MHDAPTDVLTEAYREDEYFADLLRVTGGQTDGSAGAPGDSRVAARQCVDEELRRALPAVARRDAALGPHQRVFSGRRQGADEHLLRRGGARGIECYTTRR